MNKREKRFLQTAFFGALLLASLGMAYAGKPSYSANSVAKGGGFPENLASWLCSAGVNTRFC